MNYEVGGRTLGRQEEKHKDQSPQSCAVEEMPSPESESAATPDHGPEKAQKYAEAVASKDDYPGYQSYGVSLSHVEVRQGRCECCFKEIKQVDGFQTFTDFQAAAA